MSVKIIISPGKRNRNTEKNKEGKRLENTEEKKNGETFMDKKKNTKHEQ